MYTVILDVPLLNIIMCIGWILVTYAVRVVHIMLAIAPITKLTCRGSVLYKFLCYVHGPAVNIRCMQNVYIYIYDIMSNPTGTIWLLKSFMHEWSTVSTSKYKIL